MVDLNDIGKIDLTPSENGIDCIGNGKHEGIEIQCDECDHYRTCFPNAKRGMWTLADKVICLGERPSGNTVTRLYRCPICGREFICSSKEVIYCDKCGAEFEVEEV